MSSTTSYPYDAETPQKLSAHQLIKLVSPSSSNSSVLAGKSGSGAIAPPITPKTSRLGVSIRRNPYRTPLANITTDEKMSKRSSSVTLSPLTQPLCATPKSSLRHNSSNIGALNKMTQRQSVELDVKSKSATNSPTVQGKKVSVRELFDASTSTFSPNLKVQCEACVNTEFVALTSPKSSSVRAVANVFATPTQRQHLRRQQSANATLVGGKYSGAESLRAASSTRRFTPPPGKEISSPIYAASKYSESPSAKSLPLPPEDWIQDALKIRHQVITEDALEESRPSFFLNTDIGVEDEDDSGKSSTADDASSTASSAVLFDMEDIAINAKSTFDDRKIEPDSTDSGEGSLTSVSDNECDSIAPSTPTNKAAGLRIDPFLLISTVGSDCPMGI